LDESLAAVVMRQGGVFEQGEEEGEGERGVGEAEIAHFEEGRGEIRTVDW
jgi:hypothetical protein